MSCHYLITRHGEGLQKVVAPEDVADAILQEEYGRRKQVLVSQIRTFRPGDIVRMRDDVVIEAVATGDDAPVPQSAEE